MLPSPNIVDTPESWKACLAEIARSSQIALDVESNSLFAYREEVCLIQLTLPSGNYIVDPISGIDIDLLGPYMADEKVEKILHACDYDLRIMKGQYGWVFRNVFDTMWAARILGFKSMGLAGFLKDNWGVEANKRYQKADWCKRPLTAGHLQYAQTDTHWLPELRDRFHQQLVEADRLEEAAELFADLLEVEPNSHEFDPESYISIKGATALEQNSRAVLRALHIYRNSVAERRNKPLFKILGNRLLMSVATELPRDHRDLERIDGLSDFLRRRYGATLLKLVAAHRDSIPPRIVRKSPRPSDSVTRRYDRLRQWRRQRGLERSVESDVIMPRGALWELATANPTTLDDLGRLNILGPWRFRTYGQEIVKLLAR